MARRSPRGLSARTLRHAAELFRALGHPTRLRLIECLAAGERTVGELATATREPQHAVSQQLNQLRLRGLLSRRREGRRVFYALRDPHLPGLLAWIHQRQYGDASVRDGEAI